LFVQSIVSINFFAAYIATICWALELLLLKFSILFLYIRIFPNRWLKRAIMVFTVFTILYTGPLVFLAALQCVPVYAIWDLEAQKTAKCIDWIAVLRATVVFEGTQCHDTSRRFQCPAGLENPGIAAS
jgi:hypothetical protein